MDRVLVTGGAGTTGAAVVRRLLRDPDYQPSTFTADRLWSFAGPA